MWIMEVFFITFVVAFWVFAFFMFDSLVLNGYFRKKLQHRFNVDEV